MRLSSSPSQSHNSPLTAPSRLTTALYPAHSPFLGTDPVFATKKSLVTALREERDPAAWAAMGFDAADVRSRGGRVWVWSYDFVLPTLAERDWFESR